MNRRAPSLSVLQPNHALPAPAAVALPAETVHPSPRSRPRAPVPWLRRAAPLLLALVSGPGPAAAAPAQPPRPEPPALFALVVANNQSLEPSVKPLRFADDDGARMRELLLAAGARVELLSVLDEESQALFPEAATAARPPTRAQLKAALGRLFSAIRAAAARGRRTVFYAYFAGHGHVGDDRVGYLSLLDGRFSRVHFYKDVISASPAQQNHVIIDACNAYFLVNRRGDGPSRADYLRAMGAFLARESLARYPNTGVVLSTASQADTHEWERYRGGIFSHQILSALLGAADVDGDRRVRYDEVTAYIAAANLGVPSPGGRLRVHASPPRSDVRAPLLDLRSLTRGTNGASSAGPGEPPAAAGLLRVPGSMTGHYFLEDDRGVRYLDFHNNGEQPLALALLHRPYYYLRSRDREARLAVTPGAALEAETLSFAPRSTRARGSLEEGFQRGLYAVPFGRSFALGHRSAERLGGVETGVSAAPSASPWYRRPRAWTWVSLGLAGAALAAGASTQVLSLDAGDELREGRGQITMNEAVRLQDRANSLQTAAGVSFGIAGAAAVTAAVLYLVDRTGPSGSARRADTTGLALRPGIGTLVLGGSF